MAQGGSLPLLALIYIIIACEIWRMLLEHCTVAAARRAFCNAGSSTPIRTAMIPITTNNSTSVKAPRRWFRTTFRSHTSNITNLRYESAHARRIKTVGERSQVVRFIAIDGAGVE